MTTKRDTKDYLSKKEIPQLFECLMTGLLYHRPKDHLGYLQQCLDDIREHGVNKVKWDLFIDSKSPRGNHLPPISREHSVVSQASSRSSLSKKTKLPEISKGHDEKHPSVAKSLPSLNVASHTAIVFAIGGPGCEMNFFCTELVKTYPQFVHIPMRKILPEWLARHASPSTEEQKKKMSQGHLLPDDMVLECLAAFINQHSHAKGFIIDGFPKTIAQYQAFLHMIHNKGEIDLAFLVDCDEEHLRKNMQKRGGRNEATVIEQRLNQFRSDCLPLCKELDDSGKLQVLEGEKSQEVLAHEIQTLIRTSLGLEQPLGSHHGEAVTPHTTVPQIPLPQVDKLDEGRKEGITDAAIIFVMGAPASGRSHHISQLCEERGQGFVHIDCKTFGSEGAIHVEDVINTLKSHGDAKFILVESYPTTEKELNDFNYHIGGVDAVILLDCKETTLESRVQKRDTHSAAHRQIDTFKQKTLPLVRHFDESGKLHLILADKEEAEVHAEIDNIIDSIQSLQHPGEEDNVEEDITPQKAHITGKHGRISSAHDAHILKDAKVLFVLGGPGSGKGTQCAKLVERYGFNHIATGDLLRAEVESGSERGQYLSNIMERGELVPLDIVLDLLRDAMIERVSKNNCFLIDGFPRELEQAVRFENKVCECSGVVSFDVSEEVMRQRLLKRGETSGRVDDNEETIIKRLRTFNDCTRPVLEHFQQKAKLMSFDASGSIEEIFQKVCHELDELNLSKEAHVPSDGAHLLKEAKVFFVLGGPGSGKGTQCAKLVERYGFNHIATGDLLRAEVESGSQRGQELSNIMERGELVSLDIVLALLRDAMIARVSGNHCFLIDGFPRELEQAIRFENEVCECNCVVVFDVSEETMRQRLLKRGETSGRVDDNEETIIKRLRTFSDCTRPVIEHFQEKGKVAIFDASGSVEDIFHEVCEKMDSLMEEDGVEEEMATAD